MTWRPMERVPDALSLALCAAVRATVLRRDVGRGITRDGDGMLVVPLGDGSTARVMLQARSETAAKFGPRQAIRIDLDGRAVVARIGYGLAARATVDTRTRCFVDVACEIVWRDTGAAPAR